jgi:hypothetical protein
MDVERVPCRTGKLATWHLQLFAFSTPTDVVVSFCLDRWRRLGAVFCTSCGDGDVSFGAIIASFLF